MQKTMKIPKHIKLASRSIAIKYVKTLSFDDDATGMAMFRRREIHLQKPTNSLPYNKQKTDEDFIHETLHHIFDITAMDFESKDKEEETINRIVPYLHQFIEQII